MQEVDGVALVENVEIVAGGGVAGDVVTGRAALIQHVETGQFEFVVCRGDRRDVGAVGQVGEVIGSEREVAGRAHHHTRAGDCGGAAGGGAESLGEGLGHPYGVGVVDGDLHVLGVQHPGDAGPDLSETNHARLAPVQDVATTAQERLGREHHRLADQVVLGVFQRTAGDAEHRARQLAVLQVAAHPVLSVLHHAENAAGEAGAGILQCRREVAADIEQDQVLAGGT